MENIITAFKEYYQAFSRSPIMELRRIYANNIFFKDPIHEISGIDELCRYFESMSQGLSLCEFDFTDELIHGDSAWFQWTMRYQHPRLAKGRLLRLNGASKINIHKNQVVKHEDFYDMGAMLYQHVPLLGSIVKKINKKLADPS